MAQIVSPTSKGWYLILEYTSSQDASTNQSTVSLTLKVHADSYAYNNTGNAYYKINGTTTYYTYNYPSAGNYPIATKTVTVKHNADGTGSVKLSAYWNSNLSTTYTPASLTIAEQTITLPTIPRASKLNSSNLTSTNNKIGSTMTISFTAYSTAFTHELKYKMGNQSSETSITTLSANVSSYTWTIPTSFYALCPNSTNLSGIIYLYTKSGNTVIGQDFAVCRVYVNENTNKPTVTLTLSEVNSTIKALTGFNGTSNLNAIKGYGTIRAEMTASTPTNNGASIASKKITYNNGTVDYVVAKQFTPTHSAVSVVATDTRGLSATVSKTLSLKDYVVPTITLTVNMVYNASDTSKLDITIGTKGTSWVGNFGVSNNTRAVYYAYKEDTSSTWGNWQLVNNTVGNSSYTYTTTLTKVLDSSKTYNFKAKVVDALNTAGSNEVTTSAKPIFDMSKTDFNFNVPVSITRTGTALTELKVQNDNKEFALHLAESGNRGIWDYSHAIDGHNGSWLICRRESDNRVIVQNEFGANTIYTQGINPFAANDTLTLNNALVDYPAHTSNAGKDLIFTVTYPHQSLKDVSTITVTACKLVVRTPVGYIKLAGASSSTDASGYDFYNDSNATVSAVKIDRYSFYVRITMATKFANLPDNNVCCMVNCYPLTVKFS